jgi:hypothetical protein
MCHDFPVPEEFDPEVRERLTPAFPSTGSWMTLPNQQRDMNSLSCNSVWWLKCPAREDRLNNLEAVRDPVDAPKQSFVSHVGMWRARELEHDLGLNAGLGKTSQLKPRIERG